METTILCASCGYHHSEVFVLEEKDPVRYEMQVSSGEDMSVRVVRSSKATIEVPELGVKITPGQEAKGYVSNVEGVLERISNVLHSVKSLDQGKASKAEELLKRIEGIKKGKEKINLVITDPSGNSAILSDKALVKRGLGTK